MSQLEVRFVDNNRIAQLYDSSTGKQLHTFTANDNARYVRAVISDGLLELYRNDSKVDKWEMRGNSYTRVS